MSCTSYYNLSYADYETLTYAEYVSLITSCLHYEMLIAATSIYQPGADNAASFSPCSDQSNSFEAGAVATAAFSPSTDQVNIYPAGASSAEAKGV